MNNHFIAQKNCKSFNNFTIMKRSGSADLPLHYGYVPKWLDDRMTKLGLAKPPPGQDKGVQLKLF